MRNTFFIATASALALTLAGCGGSNDTAAENDMMADNAVVMDNEAMMANDTGMADNGMTAAPLPATGQEYATMAAASDMFEIESSKLAADKAQRPEVKEFARMLVTDHQKATADLKAAAAKATPPITVSPALDASKQSMIDALKAAGPEQFDALYLSQQIPAHEQALAMLQGYAQNGDVAALKDHASKTAPVVQKHLDRARELSR